MKKILTLHFLIFSLVLLPRPTYAWGDGIPGALVGETLRKIDEQIQGTILGAIKTAAITSISSQVDRLIGGTSGDPLIIRNYDDYLRLQPQMEAETAVHNFLAKTYRSLGSTSNYNSVSGGSSTQGNYETKLSDGVKKAVINKDTYTYDLNEYCADPETSLREGDLRCLDAWKNNPANNPYGAALRAEYEYQRVRDEIRYQRQVIATSTGYLPNVDKKTGQIITPSGTVGAVVNDTRTLVNKVLAGSTSPAELASGVVLALVNRSVNSIASKAAGAVEDVVDRTVGKAVTEINKISGDASNILYTADGYIITANGYVTEAQYQSEQYNQLQQQANSSTTAPPSALPANQ